jgi:hypothetical protein
MPSTWIPPKGKVYTIAVDFDGVIHDYHRGWHDGTIYGSLIPETKASLQYLLSKYSVFVFTARDPEQVMPWLEQHGFDVTIDERCGACLGSGGFRGPDGMDGVIGPWTNCQGCKGTGQLMFWNLRDQILVTNRKLAAGAYIDDRGIRFETWEQTLADLEAVL